MGYAGIDPKRIIPNDYLYLGRIQLALKHSLGVLDLRKALTMDTTQVDIYGEIAASLFSLKKYQEAGDAYHIFAEKSRQRTSGSLSMKLTVISRLIRSNMLNQ